MGNGGRGRTRTYEAVKQGIYSPPPLPLGTLSPRFQNCLATKAAQSVALYAVQESRSQAARQYLRNAQPTSLPICKFLTVRK